MGGGCALRPSDLALQYPANKGLHIGHRGVAMYKEWLYLTTPDAHLVCLSAKNGKVRWDVPIADVSKGYWSTMSPSWCAIT